MVAPNPAVAQKQNERVHHREYTVATLLPALMISALGKMMAEALKEGMRPLSRTVFSHRLLHASATPMYPSRGDKGVHHLRPMV